MHKVIRICNKRKMICKIVICSNCEIHIDIWRRTAKACSIDRSATQQSRHTPSSDIRLYFVCKRRLSSRSSSLCSVFIFFIFHILHISRPHRARATTARNFSVNHKSIVINCWKPSPVIIINQSRVSDANDDDI